MDYIHIHIICSTFNLLVSILGMISVDRPLSKTDFLTTITLLITGPLGTAILILGIIIVFIDMVKEGRNKV